MERSIMQRRDKTNLPHLQQCKNLCILGPRYTDYLPDEPGRISNLAAPPA